MISRRDRETQERHSLFFFFFFFFLGGGVRVWLRRQDGTGQYHNLIVNLYKEGQPAFTNSMQMSSEIFTENNHHLTPDLQRSTTFFQQLLSPGPRLDITLTHLTTQESYVCLKYTFRVAHSTINLIIPEMCDAIVRHCRDKYI